MIKQQFFFLFFFILLVGIVSGEGIVKIKGGMEGFGGNNTLDGYLQIGGIDQRITGIGGFYASGRGKFNKSLEVNSEPFGVSYLATNSESYDLNYSSFDAHGSINAYNQYFCDYVNNPFNTKQVGMFLIVVPPTLVYDGAVGEIKAFVNSSCVMLSFASAGQRNVSSGSGMSYQILKQPPMIVLDRGYTQFHVGKNADAEFKIYVSEGNGIAGLHIDDTAGSNDHYSVYLEHDVNNKDGNIGLDIYTYSNINTTSKVTDGIALAADLNNFIGGIYRGIALNIIDKGSIEDADAIYIGPNFDNIIRSGQSAEIDVAWYNNTNNMWNVTDNFTTSTVLTPVFQSNSDIIYIGNTVNFTTMQFSLSTPSSGTLDFSYYFCNLSGWYQITSGVLDTTNGFTKSGKIKINNPVTRGVCNFRIGGQAFTDTTNYAYLAIQRTRNNVATSPIIRYASISSEQGSMLLAKDLLKLDPVSAPPEICSANFEGAIYYDSDITKFCYCDASSWKQMDDSSTVCS